MKLVTGAFPTPIVRFAWLSALVTSAVFGADDEPDPDQVRQDVQKFEAEYALSEGEVLARLIPPFIPERLVYYRAKDPSQARLIPQGPDSMCFRWDGKELRLNSMTFSGGQGIQVRSLLQLLGNVIPQEVEGDKPILDTQISGDFVLRAGESREHMVESLEAILRDEPKLPVRLRFRDVTRPVYVLHGEYKFTPLPDSPDAIQVYGGKLADNGGFGGGNGDFTEFTRGVGMWIERPVVGEVKDAPKMLSWRYNRGQSKDPRSVLRNLESQTGLTFEEATREIRLLFVERDG